MKRRRVSSYDIVKERNIHGQTVWHYLKELAAKKNSIHTNWHKRIYSIIALFAKLYISFELLLKQLIHGNER